ncbi:hypothetical protein B1N38_16670 [Listeria monocytogenes]|nr:hypothetical protein [Listeria monocytogenes]EAG3041323.1 hypothetical protein [Listeria monocytogenes]
MRPYRSNATPIGKRQNKADSPKTPTMAPDTALEPPKEATYNGIVPIWVVMAVIASTVTTITK